MEAVVQLGWAHVLLASNGLLLFAAAAAAIAVLRSGRQEEKEDDWWAEYHPGAYAGLGGLESFTRAWRRRWSLALPHYNEALKLATGEVAVVSGFTQADDHFFEWAGGKSARRRVPAARYVSLLEDSRSVLCYDDDLGALTAVHLRFFNPLPSAIGKKRADRVGAHQEAGACCDCGHQVQVSFQRAAALAALLEASACI